MVQRILFRNLAPTKDMFNGPPPPQGDVVSPNTRSRMMSAVRQSGTKPELRVRAFLRELGVSYRLSNRDLPGSPDMANRRRRWAVFVHGCFWHGHRGCRRLNSRRRERVPVGNRAFWAQKLEDNRHRDAKSIRALRANGFCVILIWECDLSDPGRVRSRLARLRPEGWTGIRWEKAAVR